jgi:nucleotide-binding universal stress UspA family protein
MYKKILVPTDGSELAGQAVAAAIDYARLSGGSIVACSVAQPYPLLPVVDGAMMIDPGVDSTELQQIAQQAVDEVARAARAAGVACKCDAIFIASHGRRGLSRLLAGSQTQKVLAYSHVPVLALRPAVPAS